MFLDLFIRLHREGHGCAAITGWRSCPAELFLVDTSKLKVLLVSYCSAQPLCATESVEATGSYHLCVFVLHNEFFFFFCGCVRVNSENNQIPEHFLWPSESAGSTQHRMNQPLLIFLLWATRGWERAGWADSDPVIHSCPAASSVRSSSAWCWRQICCVSHVLEKVAKCFPVECSPKFRWVRLLPRLLCSWSCNSSNIVFFA